MRRALLACLVVTGCDPVWSLRATVRSPDGAPMEGAVLAITCPDSSKRSVSTFAALTDARGEAMLGGGASLPEGCTVTVARPGHRTYTTTLEALCAPKSLGDCYRVRTVDVVLEPSR